MCAAVDRGGGLSVIEVTRDKDVGGLVGLAAQALTSFSEQL